MTDRDRRPVRPSRRVPRYAPPARSSRAPILVGALIVGLAIVAIAVAVSSRGGASSTRGAFSFSDAAIDDRVERWFRAEVDGPIDDLARFSSADATELQRLRAQREELLRPRAEILRAALRRARDVARQQPGSEERRSEVLERLFEHVMQFPLNDDPEMAPSSESLQRMADGFGRSWDARH